MDWTAPQMKAFDIFFPHASKRLHSALACNQRFVHYTNAETATKIIRGNAVWMRKSSLMKDYREVEHGFQCLAAAYQNNKQRFCSLLDGMFPGFCAKLEERFSGWMPAFRMDTYITCISEHIEGEDLHGRLSMWRAYGGVNGVAIVVNGGPFLRPSNALKAYTSPVAYLNDKDFEIEFIGLLDSIEANRGFILSLGAGAVFDNMFAAFRYAVLCTKHPGFHEEREWRVVYSPSFVKSDRIVQSIESINGVPQSIYKIPFVDVPGEGLSGLCLPASIDRVIIGPTKYPLGIYDALVSLLTEAGVADAPLKVVISDIPLRQ
jgi:hypothetical protein